ncbi:hypothetical protein SAE01_12010 [Segetibacter aerophilus]|uniref:Uncharacterized protein n=1 Tax=Segetibacter aerophilus TaxID=670293 RepID=A0A512B9S3_9BACT|nr:hypothetical protein SAE01_12010 [Segetibacter aerophilus]
MTTYELALVNVELLKIALAIGKSSGANSATLETTLTNFHKLKELLAI